MEKNNIIFVVEGISDSFYLELLKRYITIYHHSIKFAIVNTDLFTTYCGNKPIKHILSDVIKNKMNELKINKKEILSIVQITDLDGVYIKDDYIIEDNTLKDNETIYTRNAIKTKNKSFIMSRNKRKRDNLNQVISMNKLMDIPYAIYYFSTNMDDYFYGIQNMSKHDKLKSRIKLTEKYENNIDEYINLFYKSKKEDKVTFLESWNKAKMDFMSLSRITNLNLFIDFYKV